MGESINLGSKVKDKVTGFEGTVTGQWLALYGEDRFSVEALIDGRPVEAWFTKSRLEVVQS